MIPAGKRNRSWPSGPAIARRHSVRPASQCHWASIDGPIADEVDPGVDLTWSIQLPSSTSSKSQTSWDIEIDDEGEPILPEYDLDTMSGPQRKALIRDYMNSHHSEQHSDHLYVQSCNEDARSAAP